jgi:hypothetical protein
MTCGAKLLWSALRRLLQISVDTLLAALTAPRVLPRLLQQVQQVCVRLALCRVALLEYAHRCRVAAACLLWCQGLLLLLLLRCC